MIGNYIAAVEEAQAEIKQKIEALEAENAALKYRIKELEAKIREEIW